MRFRILRIYNGKYKNSEGADSWISEQGFLYDIIKKIVIGSAAAATFIANTSEKNPNENINATPDLSEVDGIQDVLPQLPQLIIKQAADSDNYFLVHSRLIHIL